MDGTALEGKELKRAIAIRGFLIPAFTFIYLLLASTISDLISASTIRNPSDFLLVNKIICVVGVFVSVLTIKSAVKLKKIDNANDAASSQSSPSPSTLKEPPYPIVRVTIFGVVVPALALWYLVYAIILFSHNPHDASFDTNVHVMWTLIKAVAFTFLGYVSFGLIHGLHKDTKDEIEKAKYENSLPKPPTRKELVAESILRSQARTAAMRPIVETRRRETLERDAHIQKLREELAALKSITAFSATDDSDLEEAEE